MQTFFDIKGKAHSATVLRTGPCFVSLIRIRQKDGYDAVQLRLGEKAKKCFLHEIRLSGPEALAVGSEIKVSDIFKEGDLVNVTGVSKGKGFAGVVKRWHFKGGPRTHGQSDRERAPGSIGSTTTPGRVLKGKRMAGRMGQDQVTVKNLKVLKVDSENNLLFLRGAVPGTKYGLLVIKIAK